MNTRESTTAAVAIAALVIGLTACQRSEETAGKGPAQRAGEQIDRATGQAADNLNKAGEQAGQALQKAGEKGGEAAQKAGEKMEGAAQEAARSPEEPKKE